MSLRIVQIIDEISMGGAEKLLITLAGQAQAYSLDITIVSLSSNNDQMMLDELSRLRTKVKIFPAKHLHDLRCIFRLTCFLSSQKFDLVQCHLTYANIIGTLCGRLAGLPVVITLHTTVDEPQRFNLAKEILRIWIYRLCTKRIVAVAYEIAAVYQARFRGRSIDVIPNAVSITEAISNDERNRLRQELVGDASRPVAISVGRITPDKGFNDLVSAFSTLLLTHPNAALLIAGDGCLFEKIRAQIRELNLEKNVVLLGMRNDVPRLLAISDIYVSSSHREGLPLTILEAMMAGLPVVATSVGDVPRLITPDIGLVVPPHQPESIAEAIAKLLDEPAMLRQMGAAGRALAIEQYSSQVWMERLVDLYAQTLRK